MRRIDLQEYKPSDPVVLTADECGTLAKVIPSLSIERADVDCARRAYHLTPGSTVGAVDFGNLSILIKPKIDILNALSLACYAIGAFRPLDQRFFDFEEEHAFPDILALALGAAARRAFANGLLHGYRRREETLQTVRGRIRFNDQIRRRFGIPMPVEVRYEEFTDDILAHQLVKAAAMRLASMRLHSSNARQRLRWIVGILENISHVEFPLRNIPTITFDRLNVHYRDVVELSRLILRHSAFESGRGAVRASGFLMNMNVIFQEFVVQALREELAVSAEVLRSVESTPFDVARRVCLAPDLTWWEGNMCMFVGDAKYKNLTGKSVPTDDLYQLLAYATALDLPGGLLIYAHGEATTATYNVLNSGKRLEVIALDLSGTLDDILSRVKDVALKVRGLREGAKMELLQ